MNGSASGINILNTRNKVAYLGVFISYNLYSNPNLQIMNKNVANGPTYGKNEESSSAGSKYSGWSTSTPNILVLLRIIPYIKKQPKGIKASHAKLLLLFLANVYNPIERIKYSTRIASVVNISIKEIVPIIEVKLDQSIFIICSLEGTFNTSFNQFINLLNI